MLLNPEIDLADTVSVSITPAWRENAMQRPKKWPWSRGRYDGFMAKKPLSETNLYLRDPEKRRKALIRSVASSTAIETGASVKSIERMLTESDAGKPVVTKKPKDSAR